VSVFRIAYCVLRVPWGGRDRGRGRGRGGFVNWDAEAFAAEEEPEDAEFPVLEAVDLRVRTVNATRISKHIFSGVCGR
jgi:hypothetical protein